jgi:uncharacterized RDD family membrane protein YckC
MAELSGKATAGKPCGLLRRLAIMLYDGLVVIAVLFLATAFAMLAGFRDVRALEDALFTLYLLAAWWLYLAACWHYGGMTLGMRAWRIRIETQQGKRPGWGACLIRFSAALASAAALGLGFAWSLFERDKRTWHDLASRTRLVRF